MIYRLVNLPLSTERYMKEWDFILHTADCNGYNESLMNRLLKRHKFRLLQKNSTSFIQPDNEKKRICVQYHPTLTPRLQSLCNRYDIQIVSSSNSQKTKTNLGSTKDKTEIMDRSVVYNMICPYVDCNAIYIGETGRSLCVRASEHISKIRNNHPEQSAIAEHALISGHTGIHKSDFNIISVINNKTRMRVCESLHIHKNSNNNNLINRDCGYVTNSCLFNLPLWLTTTQYIQYTF